MTDKIQPIDLTKIPDKRGNLKPLVSIVVPVYNAEKYLEECLNSILHQTIREWECIIVNDGSTDNSLSIIEKFAAQDNRFSYSTTPNSGSSKATRDVGVSLAKTDWIIPIDADDYVDTDMLEKYLTRANETKADIVYLRMRLFNDDNPNECLCTFPKADFNMGQIISGEEAVMLTIPYWVIGANGALIKRSIWTSLSTFMNEMICTEVDEYDTRELQLKAKSIAFTDTIYHYRAHPNSITRKFDVKLFYRLIIDKMLDELIVAHFGMNSLQSKQARQYRMDQIVNKQILLFTKGSLLSKSERKEARKLIKENYINLDKMDLYGNKKLLRILYTKNYNLFRVSIVMRWIYHLVKRK